MASKIVLRRDVESQWQSINPVLADGEMGLERNTKRFKIGDGATPWNSLSYSSSTLLDNPVNAVKQQNIANIDYDINKRMDTITYSDGNQAKYVYTPIGLVKKIVYTDTTGLIDVVELVFNYDANNRIIGETLITL